MKNKTFGGRIRIKDDFKGKCFLENFTKQSNNMIIKTSDKEVIPKIVEDSTKKRCYETNTVGAVKKFYFNTDEALIMNDENAISVRMWIKMGENSIQEHPFFRTGIAIKTKGDIYSGKKLYVEDGYVLNINPAGDIWLVCNNHIVDSYSMQTLPLEWIQYRIDVAPEKRSGIVVADNIVAYINNNQKKEKWQKIIETKIDSLSSQFVPWKSVHNKYICGIEQHGRSTGEPVKVFHQKFEIHKIK